MGKKSYKSRFIKACENLIKLYQQKDYKPEFREGEFCNLYLIYDECDSCPLYYRTHTDAIKSKILCKNHHTYPKNGDSDNSLRIEFLEKVKKAARFFPKEVFRPSNLKKSRPGGLRIYILDIDKEIHMRHRKNKLR